VKKCTIKRRYLIQNPKEVVKSILTTSSQYKKNLQQLFVENHPDASKRLAILGARFQTVKECEAFEKDLHPFLCADVVTISVTKTAISPYLDYLKTMIFHC